MSTLALVLLAIVTALIAVSALALLRWREQKRLERAREAVRQADMANSLNSTGEMLRPWLSQAMISFIAGAIQSHVKALNQMGVPVNKAATQALENALIWQQGQSVKPRRLPGQSKEAQHMRDAVRALLEYLRDAYKRRLLQADEARRLLQEARTLNLRIALAVFEDKATAAERTHNHHQAIHFLRKAEALLTQQQELPAELQESLNDIRRRLEHHEQERQQNNRGTRLEEGAALLSAEDDAWKKKKFD